MSGRFFSTLFSLLVLGGLIYIALAWFVHTSFAPAPKPAVLMKPSSLPASALPSRSASNPGPLQQTPSTVTPPGALSVAGVLAETNKARTQAGLPPLKENTILDKAAGQKVADMFARQYFEHVSPTGLTPAQLIESFGYQYRKSGENLAAGNFGTDAALVTAWMNSPGHRANILSTSFKEIGIAVGQGTYQGQRQWFAVQEFGAPLSDCTAPDATLQATITADKKELATLNAELKTHPTDTPDQVNDYNAKVDQYNTLRNTVQGLVTTYNQEIKTFNACISQ